MSPNVIIRPDNSVVRIAGPGVSIGEAEVAAVQAALDAAKSRLPVDVRDYGVTGSGEETSDFFAAASVAESGNRALFIPPGMTVQINENLELWNGALINAQGAVLDILTDHSAAGRRVLGSDVEGCRIDGLTLDQSNATGRHAVYGMLSLDGGGDHDIIDLTVIAGESTGIFTAGDLDELRVVRPRISGTWADGLHLSRGTCNWSIDHPYIVDVGDDGIGIISIEDDGGPAYNQISDGVITQPIIKDISSRSSALAVCLKLAGCKNVHVEGGALSNPVAHCAVVSDDVPAGTYHTQDCSFNGTRAREAPAGYFGLAMGVADDTTFGDCIAHDCETGFGMVGSTRPTISGGRAYGNTLGFYETTTTGGRAIGVDLRGNSSSDNVSSATLTGCVTS